MSFVQTSGDISVTTDSSGAATGYSDGVFTGEVSAVIYTKTDFDDGSTITITGEDSGQTILAITGMNASATKSPRQATHLNSDGSAALYAAAGTAVLAPICIVNERIKVVVASGGASKTGTFEVILH